MAGPTIRTPIDVKATIATTDARKNTIIVSAVITTTTGAMFSDPIEADTEARINNEAGTTIVVAIINGVTRIEADKATKAIKIGATRIKAARMVTNRMGSKTRVS